MSQTEANGARSSIRPKDAAISCAHLWAMALLIPGALQFGFGCIIFEEWLSLGSFWAGIMAVGTGIAGVCINGTEPSGGLATGFFVFLSLMTFVTAMLSVCLGEGIAYLVVRETDANCFEADDCPANTCDDHDCVCWEPDGSVMCEGGSSLRYCFSYAGDSCSGIEDYERLLLGSSVLLLIIAFFSLCSLLAAISTCWLCKRVIIVESPEQAVATYR